ncbi:MAG: PilZ domain-containing protein [Candidatus Omnitrophica bacterium]|nr:PilZ domain-containing protein [Candidatus Omnitrophota bacterium]
MDKAQERRKFIRVSEKLQIMYEIVSSKKIGEYITKNISQGGVKFLVHDFIPQGSCLRIKLVLEPYLSCEALVKIAWIRENHFTEEYEVGVEFISMPRVAQEELIEYIKTCIAVVK